MGAVPKGYISKVTALRAVRLDYETREAGKQMGVSEN